MLGQFTLNASTTKSNCKPTRDREGTSYSANFRRGESGRDSASFVGFFLQNLLGLELRFF